jgi:neutral ceramidase
MTQVGAGLHIRLRSRAYVFATLDPSTNVTDRFAFVSVDMGMGSSAVTNRVLELLDAEPTTKGLFTNDNMCLSGTHTHSAPAGFLTHTIFQVTSLGFVHQTYEAFSQGIAKSIIRATANVKPGRVFLGQGRIAGANINRSPTAYTYVEERRGEVCTLCGVVWCVVVLMCVYVAVEASCSEEMQ